MFFKLQISVLAALICSLAYFSAPVLASPVQVYECNIFLPVGPLPTDSLDFHYTIRRHVVDAQPFEETNTSLWDQAKFRDNGEFELDVRLINGELHTEKSTSVQTQITDGRSPVDDDISDRALTTETKVSVEDFVVEEFSLEFVHNDGQAISNHLQYPDMLDPNDFTRAECFISWRVPNGGVVCQVPGGGSTICTHGTHRGRISSVSTIPHEAEHGSAFTMNAGLNDAWVNEGAPLQGLFITVYPDLNIVFLSWFTFDSTPPDPSVTAVFGAPDQRWVTALGTIDGNHAHMNAELTTGGSFNSSEPTPVQDTNYGTIDLEFSDCTAGKVTFNFPSTGQSGEFNIQRVLADNVDVCEALAEG